MLAGYPALPPIQSSLTDKTPILACPVLWEGRMEGKIISWRTRRSKVLGSWSQARATWPAQTSRPSLYLPTWNGALISRRCDSTARLRMLSPATLLCLPQPVKMLFPPPSNLVSERLWLNYRHIHVITHSYTSCGSWTRTLEDMIYLRTRGRSWPSHNKALRSRSHTWSIACAAPTDMRCRSRQNCCSERQ